MQTRQTRKTKFDQFTGFFGKKSTQTRRKKPKHSAIKRKKKVTPTGHAPIQAKPPVVQVEQKIERDALEQFAYLSKELKHEDEILNQAWYRPYKKIISDSIRTAIFHNFHENGPDQENPQWPAIQAAIIMAKANAGKIVENLLELKKHRVELPEGFLLVLSLAGKNANALANYYLNAKLQCILVTHEEILRRDKNLVNFGKLFGSVDEATASKLSTLFTANPTYILTLTSGFSVLIKKGIPVTASVVDRVSDYINKNSNARISNVFAIIHTETENKRQEAVRQNILKRPYKSRCASTLFDSSKSAKHEESKPKQSAEVVRSYSKRSRTL